MIAAVTVAMENAGFIIGSYVLTFATIGVFAWTVTRRARRLSARTDDTHKYWL